MSFLYCQSLCVDQLYIYFVDFKSTENAPRCVSFISDWCGTFSVLHYIFLNQRISPEVFHWSKQQKVKVKFSEACLSITIPVRLLHSLQEKRSKGKLVQSFFLDVFAIVYCKGESQSNNTVYLTKIDLRHQCYLLC